MARKKKEPSKEPATRKEALPEAYYRLNTLLHTVRCIAQHQDRLSMLMHEIKHSGQLGTAESEELGILLAELPSQDYLDDLRATQALLDIASPS